MHKKLIIAYMAVAAFAAFIAPTASASPVLTEGGVALPAGASIEGASTSTGSGFTGAISVTCSRTRIKAILTGNIGVHITFEVPVGSASFTGTGTGGDCTSTGLFAAPAAVSVTSKLCLETVPKTDNVTITGCGGASVKFALNLTGLGPCEYSTATVLGTFVTNAGATINVLEQAAALTNTGSFCPTSGKLDMHFDLYSTGGTTQLSIS
jgi:hypothetical protein